ncbi:2-phospho-L-lactate transferase CofD family protein [Candidatus Margulisiibacteriota bacterium]
MPTDDNASINAIKNYSSYNLQRKPNTSINISTSNNIEITIDENKIDRLVDIAINVMQKTCVDKKGMPLFLDMQKDQIIKYLTDPKRIRTRRLPRVEIRRGVPEPGNEKGDIIQLGILFQNTKQRDSVLPYFKSIKDLQCVSGGRTTVEISNKGIDKALPIGFIDKHFNAILKQMGYRARKDAPINAHVNKTILIADADDTTYGKPTKDSHLTNNLSNSKSREAILDYLEAGGIYAIVSGNDLERTSKRIAEGIPNNRRHLLSQIMIIGCGGSSLCTYAPNGELVEFDLYRKIALKEQDNEKAQNLDVVYFGDNHKRSGNDFPAYKKVGFLRSVCVTEKDADKLIPELQANHLGKTHEGIGLFLDRAAEYARRHPNHKLFTPYLISEYIGAIKTEEYDLKTSKAKRLIVISGGSGPNKLAPYLSETFGQKNVKYILPPTDDGGSTGRIIKYFLKDELPAIGDFRNRIVALSKNKNVIEILKKRLTKKSETEARKEWDLFLAGTHPMYKKIAYFKRAAIIIAVRRIQAEFDKKVALGQKPFDLRGGNIGNFIITGLWFNSFKDINIAIDDLAKIGDVEPGVVLSTSQKGGITIAAKLENGQKIVGQDMISHPPKADNCSVDKFDDSKMPAPVQEIVTIEKAKIKNPLVLPGKSIKRLTCELPINRKVIKSIKSADSIVFSRGSLQTSIIPALLTEKVGAAIKEHKGRKIFMLNGYADRETKGMGLMQIVKAVVKACNDNEVLDKPEDIANYITDIIVPTGTVFYNEKDATELKKLGVKFHFAKTENKVIKGKSYAYYKDKELAGLLDRLTTKINLTPIQTNE